MRTLRLSRDYPRVFTIFCLICLLAISSAASQSTGANDTVAAVLDQRDLNDFNISIESHDGLAGRKLVATELSADKKAERDRKDEFIRARLAEQKTDALQRLNRTTEPRKKAVVRLELHGIRVSQRAQQRIMSDRKKDAGGQPVINAQEKDSGSGGRSGNAEGRDAGAAAKITLAYLLQMEKRAQAELESTTLTEERRDQLQLQIHRCGYLVKGLQKIISDSEEKVGGRPVIDAQARLQKLRDHVAYLLFQKQRAGKQLMITTLSEERRDQLNLVRHGCRDLIRSYRKMIVDIEKKLRGQLVIDAKTKDGDSGGQSGNKEGSDAQGADSENKEPPRERRSLTEDGNVITNDYGRNDGRASRRDLGDVDVPDEPMEDPEDEEEDDESNNNDQNDSEENDSEQNDLAEINEDENEDPKEEEKEGGGHAKLVGSIGGIVGAAAAIAG